MYRILMQIKMFIIIKIYSDNGDKPYSVESVYCGFTCCHEKTTSQNYL